ncbi:M81 family metallopeptidase [Roseomonas elaeocarpi]|uniref:M81 family metallopeptidase n=1 Tax=Roseomonas elaeocarpi TaxID=907779 RepID=A0ABV6JPT4_9PROT
MKRLRIGVFGMSQEAMLATPGHLDPRTVLISRGAEVVENDLWVVRGIVRALREDPAVEIVPLMVVRCRASAPFSRDFFEACKAEILSLLAAKGPFDGLVAGNHGAMEVDGLAVSGDTDLIGAIRAQVGPALPIAMALDMHGHVPPPLLRDAQAFAVFRTAPHRDDDGTGYRAARMLLRILREGLNPRRAAVHIPLFLPGEMAMTDYEPMRSLYAALPGIDRRPGILGADYMVGFAWNDRPWIGMAAVVTAEGDPELARAVALEMAATLWARRDEFGLRMAAREVGDGLEEAGRLATEGPVYLSDAGDNVTAGAYGDLTLVLQAALARPAIGPTVVCNIIAPEAVAQCHAAGIGATLTLQLGAEHLSRPATAVPATGVVEALGESLNPASAAHLRAVTAPWARVRFGHVTATFHARRIQITTPHLLEAMGIDPRAPGIFVFKVGYLHPELEDVGARHILLLSDGTSNLDLTRLPYAQIRRPALPFDPGMQWSPEQGLATDGQG